MSRLVEDAECERCGDRIDALRRLCPDCTRAGGTAMSSRASALESSKASGDALEAEIIQTIDALEYVGDRTATWHDAKTTAVLERDDLTREQRREIAETLSTRAVTFDVETSISVTTKGEM